EHFYRVLTISCHIWYKICPEDKRLIATAMRGAQARDQGVKTQAKTRRTEPKTDGPLYLQIARSLRAEIVSGIFPLGSQLPTQEELCARFNVSRFTVREALRKLRDDNLVSSRQGAGRIVAPPRTDSAYAHDVMSI